METLPENLKVGHAGLYDASIGEEDEIDDIEEDNTIVADIPLGPMLATGKLQKYEQGIHNFIKNTIIPAVKNKTISNPDVPSTLVGIWVYYFTQGIERDFGRTWDRTPYSIRDKETNTEKSSSREPSLLSKKKKNDLIAQGRYEYYENDVRNNIITQEEALKRMTDKIKEKSLLEEKGFYISPKKTEGVMRFNAEALITQANGMETGYKIYKAHHIEIVCPNVFDEYETDKKYPPEYRNHIEKTILKNLTIEEVKTHKANEKWNKFFTNKGVLGIHIGKIKESGKMKERYIVYDCIDKDGRQSLVLIGNNTIMELFRQPNKILDKATNIYKSHEHTETY